MQRILAPCRIILRQHDFRVLLVCNLLLGLAFSFVGPFFSMFGTIEVGMSPLLFGVFMTTNSLGAVALSTALAHWSDTRCSRRAILILGSLCGVAGYTAFAFLRDPLWLTVIGATVLGISSITFSQLFAHAREVIRRADVPQEDTPLYMNVFRMFIALAWTIGPAIGAWIMVRYSYRGMFLAAA
ncbi:MAG TPA: MFS transporter, partial [Opitutaceae bacterium]|nr:MFS transporter [Opitutaceae bacterium]